MARPKCSKENARLGIAESTKQYIQEGIRHVCETYKNRLPGTKSERDAQAYFKKELEGYSDEVMMQDFDVHPGAFMGWIPMAMVLVFAAMALFWLAGQNVALAIIGAILPVLALTLFLFQFLFYRSYVDFLFPKRVSRNVYATRKPSGEVKRRIIFGGHTDVAHEWTWSYLGGAPLLGTMMVGAALALFTSLVAGILNLIYTIDYALQYAQFGPFIPAFTSRWEGFWLWLSIAMLVLIVPAVCMFFFINRKIACDGANDNLSANYIAMAVIKEMHENDERFAHTEIGCLLSGSEECGLRGARAFAKMNMAMLSDPNVETVFVALDTMREIEELRVCNFGCTGTVKNDKAVGDLIHDAANKCGTDMPDTEIYPGAIDAEAFSRLGLRASGFTGVSHEAKRYYHSREDTADNIDMDCMALSLNICKEAAKLFDATGMAPYDAARKK